MSIYIQLRTMNYIFEWDVSKEVENVTKHGYSFEEVKEVFADPHVIHLEDPQHSTEEERYYAVGKTTKEVILTVRYTWRENVIRIFGAAEWRKWRKFYEKNTKSK